MNLLAREFENSLHHDELLGLSVSAKNNMHNVRGYSPNQWAFGQSSHRISSFLSSEENTPTESTREYETFEEAPKAFFSKSMHDVGFSERFAHRPTLEGVWNGHACVLLPLWS